MKMLLLKARLVGKDGRELAVELFPQAVKITDGEEGICRLAEFYHLLSCDCVDIVTDEIGGKQFELIVDDEGLLKPGHFPRWVRANGEPIYGDLLFAHTDRATGELTGIENGDIDLLKKEILRRMALGVLIKATSKKEKK